MKTFFSSARFGVFTLIVVFSALFLTGCGNSEPEERKAFIELLQRKVLNTRGIVIEPLSRTDIKAVGRYFDHYKLLEAFPKEMAKETAKNAKDLLELAEMRSLAAIAESNRALRKADDDAKKLREMTAALLAKAEKARVKLKTPEDLAPVFNAAYAKVIASPAAATMSFFEGVHAVFTATLDLVDFIKTHDRDMEIAETTINLKNPGLVDDLTAKVTLVREKSRELREAYAAMTKTLLQ